MRVGRGRLHQHSGNGRRWAGAGAVAILAGGAAAIGRWPHAWLWLAVVTAGTAAMAVPLWSLWEENRRRREASVRVIRTNTRQSGGRGGGDLPRVADVELPILRVHRAVVELPYVHRDIEDEVREALRAGRPVLLIGSSMVGKTRMAAEVVKEMFPDRPILVPDRRGALAALDAADIELRSCVIWLDDLDRLLGADGISEGAPRRLAATGNAVVATMRASQYESYVPTNLFRPPEWEVIADFERIVVRRELNEAEDRRLAELVGHELTRSQIRRTGIGEFVGASDRVAEQLKLGPVTDPVGYALVRGAADWFRMGIREPIPPDLLSSLASPPIRLGDEADRARYQAALAWATRDINPTVSLLVREQDGYVVFDFALDEFVRSGEPILDATWQLGIEHASAADLVQLGIRAVRPFQRIDIGERAWRRAADAGDTDAMVLLGALLVDRHEDSAGEALFRAAAQAGNPRAMSQLGAFFRVRRRDPVRAEHWLRQAAERQQTRAAIELGMLLEQRGDLQEAERWYRVAAAAGEEIAMFRLGMALEARGDLDQAERWYREAADSGSITASLALAVVQKRRGQAGHGLPSAEAEAGERAVEPLGQHPDRALPDHGADRR